MQGFERLLVRRSAVLARALDKTAFFFAFFYSVVTKLGEVRGPQRTFSGGRPEHRPAWIEEALIELHELTGARGGEDEPDDEGGNQR